MQPRVLLERIRPPNPLARYYIRQPGDGRAHLQVAAAVPEVVVPPMNAADRDVHNALLTISNNQDLPTLVCVCKLSDVITTEVLLLNVNKAFQKFCVPLLCYRIQPGDTAKPSLSNRSAYFLHCIRAYPERGAMLPHTQCKAVNELRGLLKGVLEGSTLLPGQETLSVTHEIDLEGCRLSNQPLPPGPGVRRIPTCNGFVYSTVGGSRSYIVISAINVCAVCQRGVAAPLLPVIQNANPAHYINGGNAAQALVDDPLMQPRVVLERIRPHHQLARYYIRQPGDGRAHLQVAAAVPEVVVPPMNAEDRDHHNSLMSVCNNPDMPTLVCVCKLSDVITMEVLLLNVNRAFQRFHVPLLCYRLQPGDTAKPSLAYRSAYFIYCIRAYPERGAVLPRTQCKAVNQLRALLKGVLQGSTLLPGQETLSVTHEVDAEGCLLRNRPLPPGPGTRRIPTSNGFVYSNIGGSKICMCSLIEFGRKHWKSDISIILCFFIFIY